MGARSETVTYFCVNSLVHWLCCLTVFSLNVHGTGISRRITMCSCDFAGVSDNAIGPIPGQAQQAPAALAVSIPAKPPEISAAAGVWRVGRLCDYL